MPRTASTPTSKKTASMVAEAGSKRVRSRAGRYNVPKSIVTLVWIRAAGHCEQCGADLTVDFRSGSRVPWGDVAHIAPASADGPRSLDDYSSEDAARLTRDPANLMLLCPGDHRRTDRAAAAYGSEDLTQHHLAHIEQIRHAARRGETLRAEGLIVLGQHWATENVIRPRDLQDAMVGENLWAETTPRVHVLPTPGAGGRDELYWRTIERSIDEQLAGRLTRRTSPHGDPVHLCIAAVADIPSLMRVGRQLGDRSNHVVFSRDRNTILRWPDPRAASPEYTYAPPPEGSGPLALVLSLSAEIPPRDVQAALPSARLATFSTPQPHYSLLRSRAAIHSFRTALQMRLSELEASTSGSIHVFAAIPAALALEFGALLSTQHAHTYVIYDREGANNAFAVAMTLGPRQPS